MYWVICKCLAGVLLVAATLKLLDGQVPVSFVLGVTQLAGFPPLPVWGEVGSAAAGLGVVLQRKPHTEGLRPSDLSPTGRGAA